VLPFSTAPSASPYEHSFMRAAEVACSKTSPSSLFRSRPRRVPPSRSAPPLYASGYVASLVSGIFLVEQRYPPVVAAHPSVRRYDLEERSTAYACPLQSLRAGISFGPLNVAILFAPELFVRSLNVPAPPRELLSLRLCSSTPCRPSRAPPSVSALLS